MDVWCYKDGQNKERKSSRDTISGRNIQESVGEKRSRKTGLCGGNLSDT